VDKDPNFDFMDRETFRTLFIRAESSGKEVKPLKIVD
jgi:translation elongation factor P/translation initiation factor 5A